MLLKMMETGSKFLFYCARKPLSARLVRRFATNSTKKSNTTPLNAWISSGKQPLTEWQRKLHRDAQRSNLWEMKQLRTYPDGKIFPAETFEAASTAPAWPEKLLELSKPDGKSVNFKAELIGLAARNAPVSFIAVSQKRILVSPVVESWFGPLRERFPNLPLFDTILLQNWMYKLINPVIKGQWENSLTGAKTFYYKKSVDLEPSIFGIDVENSYFGYVFLIENATQKIRWRGVGKAREGELENLYKVIEALTAKVKQN